ncbi:hypothetical protein BV898_01377 [Hypsibius exemplaris]|uniref:Uncharacterized protein n=1 Tax=Hypsibius exemplaris TaxID=2072580 RepID=A0A1W0XBA1_HYPEX|nr:hypothetical protein BV898_01377 [Hypsibius exemplaris]
MEGGSMTDFGGYSDDFTTDNITQNGQQSNGNAAAENNASRIASDGTGETLTTKGSAEIGEERSDVGGWSTNEICECDCDVCRIERRVFASSETRRKRELPEHFVLRDRPARRTKPNFEHFF